VEPGRQRRPGQHSSAPNQKCTCQQPQTSQGSAGSERYERAHETTQQRGWCCSGTSPWETPREMPTIERRGGRTMPPLQRLRVTRQNGEKRAPPLRGGGLGKMGCSHDGCTQADTPRFARERSEPAPSLGQPRVPFPPLSNGQRIRRRRGGSGLQRKVCSYPASFGSTGVRATSLTSANAHLTWPNEAMQQPRHRTKREGTQPGNVC
jgi:hypothetical protein